MSEEQNRQVLENYITAIENNDIDAMADLVHDDYVEEYPQSGERIRGKDNFQQVYEEFPGLPEVQGYNLYCCGDLGIIEMLLKYPDGDVYNNCEIVHFQDGKITRMTAYFAEPFEAQDWRSKWVEMMGESGTESYQQRPRGRA